MLEGLFFKNLLEGVHETNVNDFVCVIKRDHIRLEKLMRLASVYKTKENRAEFIEHLAQELEAHLKAEEEILLPVVEMKEHIRADKARTEIMSLLAHTAELNKPLDTYLSTQTKLQIFAAMFEHHAKEIELTLLPLLNNGDADPIELGRLFLNQKKHVREDHAA